MKIISGRYGGRLLTAPKTALTRPMTDKVRGALFDIIGDITDWVVLDAYAGSGAVGIEALSRGAASVVCVDLAREANQVIKKNKASLSIGTELMVIREAVERIPVALADTTFDLIAADPPYAQLDAATLDNLCRLLAANGLMVVSRSSRIDSPKLESMKRIDTRLYGDSALSFYRKV